MQLIDDGMKNNSIQVSNGINLKNYMGYIKQNSYRLLRLVNNLIDITRIDANYCILDLGNYNIVNIVEDITLSVADYCKDKEISIVFDTEFEEEIIACDPDKIERIMLNLLSNAIKYTRANGNIEVLLKSDSENIIISVKDDGIGIEKEKLPKVFDRFIQIDNILTRKCEGSGIGLSLVKSLIEMHNGQISVKSVENEGTEFTFTLPITKIKGDNIYKDREDAFSYRVEMCNVEFSDIYSI